MNEKELNSNPSGASNENQTDESNATDSSINALIDQEQTLAREEFFKEFGRQPTQAEADEWLSAHTEGY